MDNIKTEDKDFLTRCTTFCNKIDLYSDILELDIPEIDSFKNNYQLLAFATDDTGQFQSLITSFTQYQINNLRVSFSHLAHNCKNSRKYTIAIGYELGIEIGLYAFLNN